MLIGGGKKVVCIFAREDGGYGREEFDVAPFA